MRTVDRTSVPIPEKISNFHQNAHDAQAQIDLIRNSNKKASTAIYGDRTVKSSLVALYKNICFLCQKDVSARYDIEHFLPWSKYYPERAYDWSNLHQSCKTCNDKKRKILYKQVDPNIKSKVDDILLLNPSVDPVERLLSFDADSSEVLSNSVGNIKVNKTADFLNEFDLLGARKDHLNKLNKLLMSIEWLTTFTTLRSNYLDYSNITLDFSNVEQDKIGDLCYRIAMGYLSVNKEYNIFIKRVLRINTGLSIPLIKKYMSEYCQFHGHPEPILV